MVYLHSYPFVAIASYSARIVLICAGFRSMQPTCGTAQPPPPQVTGIGNDVKFETGNTALALAGRLDGDPCEAHEDDDVSIGRLLQPSPKRYLAFAITGSCRRMSVNQVIGVSSRAIPMWLYPVCHDLQAVAWWPCPGGVLSTPGPSRGGYAL
ncbi:unnamed protein product [Phytophthora lilii]|uniref:Unnamed protein product n=1 Tax=Phytophthora lilii TaxID=2077276 RepID=A0A9W6U0H7_9STRA|nr:unnamed protein product [Phytophthora lilii]